MYLVCALKEFVINIPNKVDTLEIHCWGKGGNGGHFNGVFGGGGGAGGSYRKLTILVSFEDVLELSFNSSQFGFTKVRYNGDIIIKTSNGGDGENQIGGKGQNGGFGGKLYVPNYQKGEDGSIGVGGSGGNSDGSGGSGGTETVSAFNGESFGGGGGGEGSFGNGPGIGSPGTVLILYFK